MKEFLNKPFVKQAILSLVSIGIGLIGFSMGSWNKSADEYFTHKLVRATYTALS